MEIFEVSMFGHPPESYSREIDRRIHESEMPYGYTSNPLPADTGNFDQAALESQNTYRVRNGKVS